MRHWFFRYWSRDKRELMRLRFIKRRRQARRAKLAPRGKA